MKKTEAEQDRVVEKFFRNHALQEGEDYFDSIIHTLTEKVQEVKQRKRQWKMAVDGKAHPNGVVPKKEGIVQEIKWCIDNLEQLRFHHSKGARAIGLLTKSYNLQIF